MFISEPLSLLHGDIDMLDGTKILASITFNNNGISSFDLEAGILGNIEDVGTLAFEGNNIENFRRSRVEVGNSKRIIALPLCVSHMPSVGFGAAIVCNCILFVNNPFT